ncbi:MAG: DUF3179 domain-containing protein [Candidatus Dojkabacteria bacterium]
MESSTAFIGVKKDQTDKALTDPKEGRWKLVRVVAASILGVFVLVSAVLLIVRSSSQSDLTSQSETMPTTSSDTPRETAYASSGLQTNTANSLIDLNKVLGGGPGKDGIPAIDEPNFTSIANVSSNITDNTAGMLLEHNGKARFYPFNILVWHEIVNDTIDDLNVAVTFCPLCASAIAFNRELDGKVVRFGVSGLLYETNLLMFDDINESLWSQIEGRAVVGDFAGKQLERVNVDQLTFKDIKASYPDAEILSDDTGYSRDYSYYPYGEYNSNDEEFYFPVTYKDRRLPLKELVYATSYSDVSIAFVMSKLKAEGNAEVELENGDKVTATVDGVKIILKDPDGIELPGYVTQWFSFANHNLARGVNPEIKAEVWGIE